VVGAGSVAHSSGYKGDCFVIVVVMGISSLSLWFQYERVCGLHFAGLLLVYVRSERDGLLSGLPSRFVGVVCVAASAGDDGCGIGGRFGCGTDSLPAPL